MQIGAALFVFSPFFVVIPSIIMFCRLTGDKQWSYDTSWTQGMLVLFVWALFAGLLNPHILSILYSLMFLAYNALSVHIQYNYQTEDKIEKLIYTIFLLTLGSAFLGLLEGFNIISHTPVWWKYMFGLSTIVENEDNLFRISGTFANPNFAATWYAVMILVGYYFYERAGDKKQKNLLLAGILLLTVVLVLTGSRGAVMGLLLGLVIYDFVALKIFRGVIRILMLVFSMAVLFQFPEVLPRGDLLSSTIDLRWAIWQNCFNMFLKKPITGWGIMGIYFADNNVYQYLRVLHAHNMILSVAVMLGSVGLAIVSWMGWGLILNLWHLFKLKCRLVPLLAAVQAVFFGIGIFDFTLIGLQIGYLFVGASAFVFALACHYQIPQLGVSWLNPKKPEGKNQGTKTEY